MAPRTSARAVLEAENIACDQGGQSLLRDVSLRLGGAGITVVMGPNGSGKSILLRVLHGLIPPSSGRLRWNGGPLDETARRAQALVFQDPVLLRRSAGANIDFVLRARGRADRARRDALLERVGLEGRARQPARLLSGGEQQRLALARALATEPEMLFLDEPTASLDPSSVARIEEIVRGVAASGARVVFVTHDIAQARRLADEVVFMHRGRADRQRRAAAFFDDPGSEAAHAHLEGRLVV